MHTRKPIVIGIPELRICESRRGIGSPQCRRPATELWATLREWVVRLGDRLRGPMSCATWAKKHYLPVAPGDSRDHFGAQSALSHVCFIVSFRESSPLLKQDAPVPPNSPSVQRVPCVRAHPTERICGIGCELGRGRTPLFPPSPDQSIIPHRSWTEKAQCRRNHATKAAVSGGFTKHEEDAHTPVPAHRHILRVPASHFHWPNEGSIVPYQRRPHICERRWRIARTEGAHVLLFHSLLPRVGPSDANKGGPPYHTCSPFPAIERSYG
jgi:hypothetical protein